MCRHGRTGTPRREGRPTRAASTRTTRARGPASSTPAKGSRPGKYPKLAAPASRQRPAGCRACKVLGAPGHERVAVRPMVRAAARMTRKNVPRRRAGSAPPTDEEVGVAVSPSCRIRWVDRDCFWRSARRITAAFRGSKLYGRRRDPAGAARATAGLPGTVYALRETSGSSRSIGEV